MATIAVLGTFDTKGEEHGYVAELIRQRGHRPLLIDVGILDAPRIQPDIAREQILRSGGIDLKEILARKDRGEAVAAMMQAAPPFVARYVQENEIAGIISLGGSGGTSIGTAVMRALPLGFPKVMVSTVVCTGNIANYLGVKDIVMFPAVVDVSGLNRLSRRIYSQAVGAVCGMVEAPLPQAADKPIIAASMFGNTTRCIEHARQLLEAEGFEVLVFHANGTGGRIMESVIESGAVAGVLDVTTTEWADELVGGTLGAGSTRLEAAARKGIPAIIAPGCLDMVNFGPPETVPKRFAGRNLYQHNPQVTLMRTTPEECAVLGKILAEKANLSIGPVTVLFPRKAISVISGSGQKFHDPSADEALYCGIKKHLRPDIPLVELECEINDPRFAEACVESLLKNLALARKSHSS